MITWSKIIDDINPPKDALDFVQHITAPARQRDRAEIVAGYAADWAYTTWGDDPYYDKNRDIAVICMADMIGLGGQYGIYGCKTDRHPALTSCGKGRKHATDGPAWSAAIKNAYQKICYAPGLPGGYEFIPHKKDNEMYLAIRASHWKIKQECQCQEISIIEKLIPEPWRTTIAKCGVGIFLWKHQLNRDRALITKELGELFAQLQEYFYTEHPMLEPWLWLLARYEKERKEDKW